MSPPRVVLFAGWVSPLPLGEGLGVRAYAVFLKLIAAPPPHIAEVIVTEIILMVVALSGLVFAATHFLVDVSSKNKPVLANH
jgi:hypothetical protein